MPPSDEPLTERHTIRFTLKQRELWEQVARADRRSLTDWIRIQLDDAVDRQLTTTAKGQKGR